MKPQNCFRIWKNFKIPNGLEGENFMKVKNCRFHSTENFAAWQNESRRELIDLLGITELLNGERCPLNPRSLWKRENELGTIEKIAFDSEPGVENLIYLCIPHGVKPPYRAFICLQGHSTGMHTSIAVDWHDEITPLKIEGDRDFAIGCMKRGIPAVCLEQRYMGEHSTDPEHQPACYEPAMRALMRGSTALGERVFDVDRTIDWMASRGDFDMTQIGIMGNSGGGTTSMFAGAVLPRLTHVMPSCSFSSFADSICAMHHCSCNYVPHLLEYGESADVVGLTAPRPLVIVNGIHDPIFPLSAANEQFGRLRAIYAASGAPENCVHVLGDGEHRFYAEPAWNAMLKFWK